MRDLEHLGRAGELDTALRLVESELPPAGAVLRSVLAVAVYATWQLAAAIDRCAAKRGD